MINTLMAGKPSDPLDGLFRGAASLGVGAPISLIETLMDQYMPKTKPVDVQLPGDHGITPDRLKELLGNK